MHYSIRHVTRFRYSAPISESVMEVRMQPRTEGLQRCHKHNLSLSPRRARLSAYRDYFGNTVYHFDVPGQHSQLTITAESLVELSDTPSLPLALGDNAWTEIDNMVAADGYWDMLKPSNLTQPGESLEALAVTLNVERRADPLTLLRELNRSIYDYFDYAPQTTAVDSPIDDALRLRKGVCQDFAHVMIALVRRLGIPCRYVSGYLFHRAEENDRSAADATHAWVEALLPELGWVGFDPTNNLIVSNRHICIGVGRDYGDVPPTRGVFKGDATSELDVAVYVSQAEAIAATEELLPAISWEPMVRNEQEQQQQQ